MARWYRVFGRRAALPDPAALLAHLRTLDGEIDGRFQGDGSEWWSAEFLLAEKATPLRLDRFLASEEGIRAELNSWAAYLETCESSPQHAPLMERMIQTQQLFVLQLPVEDERVARICVGLCEYLAQATEAVWQVDGQGFFAADGTLLLREE
jgi:hypothetical protein